MLSDRLHVFFRFKGALKGGGVYGDGGDIKNQTLCIFTPQEITCDASSGHPLTCTTGSTPLLMDAVCMLSCDL